MGLRSCLSSFSFHKLFPWHTAERSRVTSSALALLPQRTPTAACGSQRDRDILLVPQGHGLLWQARCEEQGEEELLSSGGWGNGDGKYSELLLRVSAMWWQISSGLQATTEGPWHCSSFPAGTGQCPGPNSSGRLCACLQLRKTSLE